LKIFTIGFTKKTSRAVFLPAKAAGNSPRCGCTSEQCFAACGIHEKRRLRYFLGAICKIEYVHLPELASTQGMLDAYKKKKGDWSDYAAKFLRLMEQRKVQSTVPHELLDGSCLLCSEDTPEF